MGSPRISVFWAIPSTDNPLIPFGLSRATPRQTWWDAVYEDFQRICEILGIRLKTTPVRLMGGGTRAKPCIWFSGFWGQGDGACYAEQQIMRSGQVITL